MVKKRKNTMRSAKMDNWGEQSVYTARINKAFTDLHPLRLID